jgi:beta-galactosidase
MQLGVDYYPEQWPEARWPVDARMMAELGLAYVRIGEFAWSLLEPEEGRFDFTWLERAIAVFQAEKLPVILGTPTAAPPPWLTGKYDIFQRDENRLVLGPGSRRHACANNAAYLEHTRRIVTGLAQHFGQHAAVIGWQVDNEFGCNRTTWCFCEACHVAFQAWLKDRYGSLEELNQAWGTVFWSAIYTGWSQIPLPWRAPAQHNPSLQLDFRRFSSESWVRYQKLQIDILRQYSSNRFITHNFMGSGEGGADQQDYYELGADLDFVSWDNYPQGSLGIEHVALNHDMMRGFKRRSYWVMEQQPGVVNWHPYNRPVPPGLVRLWTYQGFGHGAEAVVYFRWRAGRFGQEQYHMGVLRQDGSPTRLYQEAGQVSQELKKLPSFSRKQAQVAILFDYADWWSIQIDPHQQDFSYLKLVRDIYRDLWAAGVSVDVIRRSEGLDQYQVVLVPAPILIEDADADRWQRFVENGGRLMMTFRGFAKEQSNIWTDQPLPANLIPLLGTKVEEYLGLPPDMRGAARDVDGKLSFPYWRWAEVLAPTTGQPLMFYNQFYWRDRAAVTKHEVGRGVAVMVGCWFEHMLPAPVWEALGLDQLAVPFRVPQDVEVIPIAFETGGEGLLLLNHQAEPVLVHLHQPASELLLDLPPTQMITLQPKGVAVVKFG